MLSSFIKINQQWSRKFDGIFPSRLSVDGNRDFIADFAPKHIRRNERVIDVGSGKQPLLSTTDKARLGLFVCGLDISSTELARAPLGAYDEVVCTDVTSYVGTAQFDLAICQSLLEHVSNTEAAIAAMASALKPGGRIVLFVPCRNALFARLNLLLPEKMKQSILFTIFPQSRHAQGFKSYYNKCTPADFRRIAALHGLVESDFRSYFMSSYFSFFFPLYAIWRIWTVLFKALAGDQAAETFSMALTKR